MKRKALFGIGIAAAIGVVGWSALKRSSTAPQTTPQLRPRQLAETAVPMSVPEPAGSKAEPRLDPAPGEPAHTTQTAKNSRAEKAAQKPAKKAKEPLRDPDARAALALVGDDPDAEQYWVSAINNPSLPANERKDLIEDLNEEGFSDPKHPAPQEMPLILNRLELIEALAPYSMDDVNLDAFAEAYRDLVNMLNGQPVQ